MKDLIPEFRKILVRETEANHTLREKWGVWLFAWLNGLEDRFNKPPYLNRGDTVEPPGFPWNLEVLLTQIDVARMAPVERVIVREGGERVSQDAGQLFKIGADPGGLRGSISTYLSLSLTGPYPESDLLNRFIGRIDPSDSIVTFNYDLVLESALFRQNRWNPADGYGITFDNVRPLSNGDSPSQVQVHKLHGSLNWEIDEYPPGLRLRSCYDDLSEVFEGCSLWKYKWPRLDEPYQGAHHYMWMLPSFVKTFDQPQMYEVWRNATEAMRRSDEIVLIGYSLPEADSAAKVLFATATRPGKCWIVVDPSHALVTERLRAVTAAEPRRCYNSLEAFLSDCPPGRK
jgi:hypothetical protein